MAQVVASAWTRSWTEEEMAAMWGNRPVPVVQQSIDDVCLPAKEGGPDLNAIGSAIVETLERVLPETEQHDIPGAPSGSMDTTIVHAIFETLVRVLSKPEQQGIAAAQSDSTGAENQ